jgi:hypothetical protein
MNFEAAVQAEQLMTLAILANSKTGTNSITAFVTGFENYCQAIWGEVRVELENVTESMELFKSDRKQFFANLHDRMG